MQAMKHASEGSTLVLKSRVNITRSLKLWYQSYHKKNYCPPKNSMDLDRFEKYILHHLACRGTNEKYILALQIRFRVRFWSFSIHCMDWEHGRIVNVLNIR